MMRLDHITCLSCGCFCDLYASGPREPDAVEFLQLNRISPHQLILRKRSQTFLKNKLTPIRKSKQTSGNKAQELLRRSIREIRFENLEKIGRIPKSINENWDFSQKV